MRARNFRAIRRVPMGAAGSTSTASSANTKISTIALAEVRVSNCLFFFGEHGGEQLRDMSTQHSRKVVDLL
jgi:hypothetical protein